MPDLIQRYVDALWGLTLEMSPYLLLGFFIAGLLYVYFPKGKVAKYLGKDNFSSTLNAALIGIPLPLCSCGVIPTGISFYKNGASRGSSVSFLISTPQTGVDSIFATYALLGLPLAIIRPLIALVTGVIGGLVTNSISSPDTKENANEIISATEVALEKGNKIGIMLRYAFVEFLQDISKWLVIGLLLAALMAVLIPDDFFINYLDNEYLSMLIVLVASIPLYVCATGSVPIAAVLLMKGLSPGAAIVFLMAGPATNAATITVIGKVLGRKTLVSYMASIIGGAILFGIIVNEFLPREWFTSYMDHGAHGHGSHLLPHWLNVTSAVLLILLLINGYLQKYWKRNKTSLQKTEQNMAEKTIKVNGMTCNHCKANVQSNLAQIQGIENIDIDLESGKVKMSGDRIDLAEVKNKVEGIGYEYAGEI
ncbi:MAG: heavy metal-associated domain-containing protein [Cyclobacteriaceae bacterium]|nr:heavy metal-associated domain-containing protein [Cyclobacteriaceae bacterium]